jgi:hypothetical protein
MARTPGATVDLPAYQAAAYAITGDQVRAAACLRKFLADFYEKITFGRPPDPGEPFRWLEHVNPFRRKEDFLRLKAGLERAGLQLDPDDELRPTAIPAFDAAGSRPVFRKEGELWSLRFEGLALQLNDVKGFHDIAELLPQPHQPIHCLDLAGRSLDCASEDAVMDNRARRELSERAQVLQQEIDEAERFNDRGRLERARNELEQIAAALSQAFGLSGKPRRLGSAVERARSTVTWRIRSAIRKVGAAHPALGKHLENSIRTGTYCCYAPEREMRWEHGQGFG